MFFSLVRVCLFSLIASRNIQEKFWSSAVKCCVPRTISFDNFPFTWNSAKVRRNSVHWCVPTIAQAAFPFFVAHCIRAVKYTWEGLAVIWIWPILGFDCFGSGKRSVEAWQHFQSSSEWWQQKGFTLRIGIVSRKMLFLSLVCGQFSVLSLQGGVLLHLETRLRTHFCTEV